MSSLWHVANVDSAQIRVRTDTDACLVGPVSIREWNSHVAWEVRVVMVFVGF